MENPLPGSPPAVPDPWPLLERFEVIVTKGSLDQPDAFDAFDDGRLSALMIDAHVALERYREATPVSAPPAVLPAVLEVRAPQAGEAYAFWKVADGLAVTLGALRELDWTTLDDQSARALPELEYYLGSHGDHRLRVGLRDRLSETAGCLARLLRAYDTDDLAEAKAFHVVAVQSAHETLDALRLWALDLGLREDLARLATLVPEAAVEAATGALWREFHALADQLFTVVRPVVRAAAPTRAAIPVRREASA